MDVTYSDFTKQAGGIGYRADLSNGHSYTTNPDGSGLFFHNGKGGRQQTHGNGQFQVRSLAAFKRRISAIIAARYEGE